MSKGSPQGSRMQHDIGAHGACRVNCASARAVLRESIHRVAHRARGNPRQTAGKRGRTLLERGLGSPLLRLSGLLAEPRKSALSRDGRRLKLDSSVCFSAKKNPSDPNM